MDTVAPTVVITSPANGATVNGNIKVVASPAKDGIANPHLCIAARAPWAPGGCHQGGRADAKKVDRALDELLVSRLSTRPTDLAAEPGTNSGIASVAFYLDGTRLGTVTSAP
jgi:hypothetical protein